MNDLVNILKEKISLYKPKIKIKGLTVDSGVYEVLTCNTYYINNHRRINVNGVEAKVTGFVKDTYFTFKFDVGVSIPDTIDHIELQPFKFFYGTTTSTSEEVSKIHQIGDKVPFIWLYSVYSETTYRGDNRKPYRDAQVTLFALDQCDYKNWLDIEHHNNVIVPLNEYVNGLLDYLDTCREFRQTSDVTTKGHANFGRYIKEGHVEKIFDENLSGVQAELNIQVNNFKNKCCG